MKNYFWIPIQLLKDNIAAGELFMQTHIGEMTEELLKKMKEKVNACKKAVYVLENRGAEIRHAELTHAYYNKKIKPQIEKEIIKMVEVVARKLINSVASSKGIRECLKK